MTSQWITLWCLHYAFSFSYYYECFFYWNTVEKIVSSMFPFKMTLKGSIYENVCIVAHNYSLLNVWLSPLQGLTQTHRPIQGFTAVLTSHRTSENTNLQFTPHIIQTFSKKSIMIMGRTGNSQASLGTLMLNWFFSVYLYIYFLLLLILRLHANTCSFGIKHKTPLPKNPPPSPYPNILQVPHHILWTQVKMKG